MHAPIFDPLLNRILRQWGAYYHAPNLFYQELWAARLHNLGFIVTSIKKSEVHHIWDIRMFPEARLGLVCRADESRHRWLFHKMMVRRLSFQIKQAAEELGRPIHQDCLTVIRSGRTLRVVFIWRLGKPGAWFRTRTPATAFSARIQAWLRKMSN